MRAFSSVAFDSGGVTTGPMTVPFIMALGVGVASIRSDKNAEADSFGLVALCSIGPILAVMLLGFFYEMEDGVVAASVIHSYADTVELGGGYLRAIPEYMGEVALALAPIVGFFLLFQVFALHLRRVPFLKIIIGLVYTYVGLVLFLVGVNVGFSSLGTILGASSAIQSPWLLVPIAMVMGWFIISAEPAVHVLNKQVEEIERRGRVRKGHGPEPLDSHRAGDRARHGEGADGHLDTLVRRPRLCHSAGHELFRAAHLHRHRL